MNIPSNKRLILFDGYCQLCNKSVQLILKFDKNKTFFFSPLTGIVGIQKKKELGIPNNIDSIVLIVKNSYYTRSEAVFIISKELGGFFKLIIIFKLLPIRWSDSIYQWIATNRYKWLKKMSSCMVPKPEFKDRFL